MSIDHITMLQISAGKAFIYAYEYTSNPSRVYHIKSEDRLPLRSDTPTYGIVRSGTDGKPAVIRILSEVTHTFRPVEDIKYNWLIDTVHSVYFSRQERLFNADREAEHRLEHAQAMEKVRTLQAQMSVDILTGLPNTPATLLPPSEVSVEDRDDGIAINSPAEEMGKVDNDDEAPF